MRYLFFALLLSSTAFAQDSTISYNHRYALKLDLGALIDPDRTIQAGLEFPIGRRTSWQTVVGYGWKGLVGGELNNFDAAEIWRVRNEVRFYTGRYRTNRNRNITIKSMPPLGNYWALELLTKQINYRDVRDIRNSDTQGVYTIQTQYTARQRYVLGLHVKASRQFALAKVDKSPDVLLLDVYLGAGIRYSNVVGQDAPARNEDIIVGIYNRFNPGVGIAPSLVAGVKMGFAL